ncbi:RtcB family protein [Rhodocytophaga aerolata]|uniref:3'-phosphate/5'-hydroxy nucleic acid ligase n=1 Tax=Rhodocytophaga aerolata TaxID=455078 RepID=A0ABT8R1X7_9BACT|nr:RtcB family protein [Rhodocytophaga aerolata]MDO1445313.1 RtcB family protein [Rhodocytophaga aerolata]
MAKQLNNNELRAIGFYESDVLKSAGKLAKNLIKQKEFTKEELLAWYAKILENPQDFTDHEVFGGIAQAIQVKQPAKKTQKKQTSQYELKQDKPAYKVYGPEQIEAGALQQMDTAMKLPVAVAGSLMPDAHHGYGLPIGGVLATTANTVIPFAVGVDIACRMCMSVFDIEAHYIAHKDHLLKSYLQNNTVFGLDTKNMNSLPDDIFDNPNWKATSVIRGLRQKAEAQLGSSGTGNHFVEWGILEITEETKELRLPKGKYLALLSHSGSRGFGANIANHYSKLAMERTKLPREAQHLAWLDLNTEEGQEYWIGMNLAGEYASANHHQIHRKMAKALGVKPSLVVENHHNFAWKETLADGTPVIVHRKGATPAGKGVLGIIPGSSAQPGFVVKGKGNPFSINSASHGAGRLMSRSKALNSLNKKEVREFLAEKGVTLIGGDLDEAPMVYKDIHAVIAAQADLVEVLGNFTPKIVRMADPDRRKGCRED